MDKTKQIVVQSVIGAHYFQSTVPWACISIVTEEDTWPKISEANRVGLLQLTSSPTCSGPTGWCIGFCWKQPASEGSTRGQLARKNSQPGGYFSEAASCRGESFSRPDSLILS